MHEDAQLQSCENGTNLHVQTWHGFLGNVQIRFQEFSRILLIGRSEMKPTIVLE